MSVLGQIDFVVRKLVPESWRTRWFRWRAARLIREMDCCVHGTPHREMCTECGVYQ